MNKFTIPILILLTASLLFFGGCNSDSNSAAPYPTGTGGSLARFAIVDDHLYTVSNTQLRAYDISLPQQPRSVATIALGMNIETIFPYNRMLFIGSRTGMHIYDNANPTNPTLLSRYDHVESCDPVVVQGNYAYVTLRDGTSCRFGQNLMDVIDIANPRSPRVVNSLSMINPHGLGIKGNTLFVSEGEHGLKVFDATDPVNLVETQFIRDVRTFDVIPHNNLLLVVGQDGLYQYDYSDRQQLKLVSKIPIGN